MPCTDRVLPFSFSFGFVNRVFPLNSHNVGDIVEKIVDVPEKAVSVVQTTTSQASSGSAVPREKLKLAFMLLGGKLSSISSTYFLRLSSVY